MRTKKARKEISTVMKRVRRAMDDAYQDTWITWMVLTLEQNFPVCFTRRLHLFQPPLCRRRRTLICNGKWSSSSSSSSSSDALTRSLPNAAAAQFDLYSSFPRDSVAPLAAKRRPQPTRYFSSESVRACVRAPLSVLSVHPFHGQVSEAMWWSPLYSPAPLDSGGSLYFRSSQIDGVTGGNG